MYGSPAWRDGTGFTAAEDYALTVKPSRIVVPSALRTSEQWPTSAPAGTVNFPLARLSSFVTTVPSPVRNFPSWQRQALIHSDARRTEVVTAEQDRRAYAAGALVEQTEHLLEGSSRRC